MREAFHKAIEQNPNSSIVPVIKGVTRDQAAARIRQREERRFGQLREKFKEVGLMWFGTRFHVPTAAFYRYVRIPIEERRKQWLQALTSLNDKPLDERTELLKALASGMGLERDNIPPAYKRYILEVMVSDPLGHLGPQLLGVNFTSQSMIFMKAISDMSSHSEKQKQEFRDFMARQSGLKGKVELPQLFPAISRWFEHSGTHTPSES